MAKENQTGIETTIPGMENAMSTADKVVKPILLLFVIGIR
jgi:hypothetical protein